MSDARRGALAWLAIVGPVWLVLALCTHWEPVAGDGWGHLEWHRSNDVTLANVLEFARGSYEHNNPRLGQVIALLLHTPGPWHAIVTPVVELAVFALLAALALGRWPSPRRADDALVFAIIVAIVAASSPEIGPLLFYRPYTGNYVYGLALCLALLVPYRFAFARAAPPRPPWWHALAALAMIVAGLAAGVANEHTGPTVALAAIAACVVATRRGELAPWMIGGALGVVAGGLLLFYAPGQEIRYNGIATHESLLGRALGRGGLEVLRILFRPYLYTLPALAWLGVGVAARRLDRARAPLPRVQAAMLAALVAASFAIVATLLVSPKQGPRLFFASQALVAAAVAGWVVPQLAARWARVIAAALVAVVLAFVGGHCVHVYATVGPEFATRLDALARAPMHSVLDLPAYSIAREPHTLDARWWWGDDLLVETKRNQVSAMFGLALIRMSAPVDQRSGSPEPP